MVVGLPGICFTYITKVFLELGRSPSELRTRRRSGIPKDTCENGPNAPWDLKCLPTSYHSYHGILECTPWKINMQHNNEGFEEVTFKFPAVDFYGVYSPWKMEDLEDDRFAFWDGIVSGAMLASGRVNNTQQTAEHQESS